MKWNKMKWNETQRDKQKETKQKQIHDFLAVWTHLPPVTIWYLLKRETIKEAHLLKKLDLTKPSVLVTNSYVVTCAHTQHNTTKSMRYVMWN